MSILEKFGLSGSENEKLSYIQGLVKDMQDNDDKKHDFMEDIDDMMHLEWELPEEIKDLKWMRAVVSTDPHDAVNTGARILSTVEPIPRLQPLAPGPENREAVNEIEQVLRWQYSLASKRVTNVTKDIVQSALRYDEVCAQVVYLPWQAKSVKASKKGKMPERWEQAQRYGKYAIIVENPQDVHARFNYLGLDTVALSKVMKAREAAVYYNSREIARAIEEANVEMYVTIWDVWSLSMNRRATWGFISENDMKIGPTGRPDYIFMDQKMDLPFMPWAIKRGGISLEKEEKYKINPMLAPIVRANVWEDQNVADSLAFSESISYAAAPRGIIYNDQGEIVRIDYGEPNKPIRLGPNQNYEQLDPPQIDQALMEISDRLKARGDKSTVARFLQNLDFPAGTAFATVNAVIKSATSALDPAKELAEETLGEVFRKMLFYIDYTEEPLLGYEAVEDDEFYGGQYLIQKGDFDPNALYLTAKLTANVPTDYQQRVNTGVMMKEQLDFPKGRIYEFLDVPDGEQAISERRQEQLDELELQLAMQRRQLEEQMEIQRQQQEMIARQQRAIQNQQGAIQGQGFNPAQGGRPPAEAAPRRTREQQTGRARGGEELA